MKDHPLVSIIINNYNYQKYVETAIESALNQTYYPLEVIIVDDGSTDNSREIIKKYSNRTIQIFKDNGGQASAFNQGFECSKGEILIFLDSDDILKSDAVEVIVKKYIDATDNKIKFHWPLSAIDNKGIHLDILIPKNTLAVGNLKEHVINYGPASYNNPPTSGNAWSRDILSPIFPIPEKEFRISADAYLFTLTPLYCNIVGIEEPLSFYRIHGNNNFWKSEFSIEKLKKEVEMFDVRCNNLAYELDKLKIKATPKVWKESNWLYLSKAISIKRVIYSEFPINLSLVGIKAVGKSDLNIIKKVVLILWFLFMGFLPKKIAKIIAKKLLENR